MKSDRKSNAAEGSNRSKDRGIELINKKYEGKEKKSRSTEKIDSYIMGKWFNTVAKELVSWESQNITTGY